MQTALARWQRSHETRLRSVRMHRNFCPRQRSQEKRLITSAVPSTSLVERWIVDSGSGMVLEVELVETNSRMLTSSVAEVVSRQSDPTHDDS